MNKGYIHLMHEYAAEHIDTGFTHNEMISYIKKQGINFRNKDHVLNIYRVFSEIVGHGPQTIRDLNKSTPKLRHFMLSEAYFRYMSHLEMKAAQDNAKSARKWAVIAIFISGFLPSYRLP